MSTDCPCLAGTFGSLDYWFYRMSVSLISVPWFNMYGLQEISRWTYIFLNLFIVYLGFVTHEIAALLVDTGTGLGCMSHRPPRLPEFNSYAVGFYFTLLLLNGILFQPAYRFGWPQILYVVVAIIARSLGLRNIVAATLGEMYISTLVGAVCACGVFILLTFIFRRLVSLYRLERDAERLATVGVKRFL